MSTEPMTARYVDESWLNQPEHVRATKADVQRLEAKVDELIHALKAGAIGQWGNKP